MSICPICGCKTDEIDFVTCSLGGSEQKACSFCGRQLKMFESESVPGEAQLRWLDSVLQKEVPGRPIEVLRALGDISARVHTPPGQGFNDLRNEPLAPTDEQAFSFAGQTPARENIQQAQAQFENTASRPVMTESFNSFSNATTAGGAVSNDAAVKALYDRVEKLEASFKKYKKMQLIKAVLEIVVPIILVLIILIIFFASGLFDSMKQVFSIADMTGMACVPNINILNIFLN